jgi:hypothetical protein
VYYFTRTYATKAHVTQLMSIKFIISLRFMLLGFVNFTRAYVAKVCVSWAYFIMSIKHGPCHQGIHHLGACAIKVWSLGPSFNVMSKSSTIVIVL